MNNHKKMSDPYSTACCAGNLHGGPIDADTLLATPLPPVRWLIPGLLPAGLSLLAGASKAGKSWLCLWLCLRLAQGGSVWNRPVQPQTVLYLCLEDTLARVQARLFRLASSDAAASRLYFQTQCGGIGEGLELQIGRFLHQHPETGLIVIDTLQKVRTAEPNVGAYASDYQDMSVLKSLADRHNIALLLVHHLRKQGAADPFQQISGSNGLMGAADTIWLLQRQRMSDTARLLVTGRDMDSRTLHLQAEHCVWQLLEEDSAEEQAEKAIPAWLRQAADYLLSVKFWQGTASKLLAAAGITGVQPNQFARKLIEYYDAVFAARGIRYESHRTANARRMCFWCDKNDGDDDPDVVPRTTQTSSLPSSLSQGGAEMSPGIPHGNAFGSTTPTPPGLPKTCRIVFPMIRPMRCWRTASLWCCCGRPRTLTAWRSCTACRSRRKTTCCWQGRGRVSSSWATV